MLHEYFDSFSFDSEKYLINDICNQNISKIRIVIPKFLHFMSDKILINNKRNNLKESIKK